VAKYLLLEPDSGKDRSRIFTFIKPVKIGAYNLPTGETVTFEQVLQEDQTKIISDGKCCVDYSGTVVDIATKPYQVGCCTPTLEGGKNTSLIIDTPSSYRAILSAGAVGIATIEVSDVDWAIDITQELRGCPCDEATVCVDTTWTETGLTKCENHLVVKQEESNCGNKRWTVTTETCGYCPSEPIQVCDGVVGYGYIENDTDADPLATTPLNYCDGGKVMIYPDKTSKHSVEVKDCDGNIIGYAANKQCCETC